MSEEIVKDEPVITPELVAAYNKKQAQLEQEAMQQCVNDVLALVNERGFVILGVTRQVEDGRPGVVAIGATWGIQKKAN